MAATQDLLAALTYLQTTVATMHVAHPVPVTAQALALLVFWVVLCYVTGVLSQNYSQVDKLWSVTPWLYVWVWALQSDADPRLTLMAVASTIWGCVVHTGFGRSANAARRARAASA
jgi:steroid 5-alpha reductase family enzyme